MKWIVLLALCSSCCLYKMPQDEDFSTVPLTNNPHVTRDPGRQLVPGMNP